MLLFRTVFWFILIINLYNVIIATGILFLLANLFVLAINAIILKSLYFTPRPVDGSSLLAQKLRK